MNLDTSSEPRKIVKDTKISKILRKKSEIFKIFKISKNPKTSFLMFLSDLEQQTTPFLRVDLPTFESNLLIMSDALPGTALRPHVKAFKSTAVAKRLYSAGHTAFCCATVKEMEGMASVGLSDDLLLANEVLISTQTVTILVL